MDKRKLFFWLEKLRITPQERITVVVLLILLGLLALLNMIVEQSVYYDQSDYRAIEMEFRKRSAMLAEQEAQILARYPPPAAATGLAGGDSVPVLNDTAISGFEEEQQPEPAELNINTADIDQLQALPGIGPSYAQRIVDYRKKYGPFRSIEELKKIRGIGDKRLEKLRPHIAI